MSDDTLPVAAPAAYGYHGKYEPPAHDEAVEIVAAGTVEHVDGQTPLADVDPSVVPSEIAAGVLPSPGEITQAPDYDDLSEDEKAAVRAQDDDAEEVPF